MALQTERIRTIEQVAAFVEANELSRTLRRLGYRALDKPSKALVKRYVRDFTKSRPRRSTDNAVVEGKNAAVVRRFLGHDHLPQRFAPLVDAFARDQWRQWGLMSLIRRLGLTILAALRPGDLIRMETSGAYRQLPSRPAPVTAGAALLLGSAVLLVLTWVFGVDAVESNGARVFFVVLWGFLAYSAYSGAGWVRGATVVIFGIAILGFVNAPSFVLAVRAMPIGEVGARALAVAALVALWSPPANGWFAAVKAARMAEGR